MLSKETATSFVPRIPRSLPVEKITSTVHNAFEKDSRPQNVAARRIRRLKKIKGEEERLGYVTGPIASANPIQVLRNVREIRSTAKRARLEHGIKVGTPLDAPSALQLIRRATVPHESGNADVWRASGILLREGVLTDVFPTSNAAESTTSQREINLAEELPHVKLHPTTENLEAVA